MNTQVPDRLPENAVQPRPHNEKGEQAPNTRPYRTPHVHEVGTLSQMRGNCCHHEDCGHGHHD